MADINADVRDAIKGLDQLEKKLQRKGVRRALRASAKPTYRVSKATAPVFTGATQENVKLRSAGVRRGVFSMVVGVGKKWFTGKVFYSAFVAFGHRIGKRQLGDVRRLVAPNDWLTKAYEATKAGAIALFRESIEDFIERGGE